MRDPSRRIIAALVVALACATTLRTARAQTSGDGDARTSAAPPSGSGPGSTTDATGAASALPIVPRGPATEVRLEPPLPGEDPWLVVGIHRGDILDRVTVRGALRAALASGTFAEARASVRAVPGGIQLLIEGERRIRLRDVAFVGVQARPLDAVRTEFGPRAGAWVTENAVDRAIENLQNAYQANGWSRARVSARWRDTDDPATRLLIVSVDEGPPTTVRRVVLQGIPRDIEDTVRGSLGLAPGDIANPQVPRRAMDPLAAEIRRAGYFNVALSPVRFEPVGPSSVDVIVSARTGPRYRIRWLGTAPFPDTALEAALRIDEERGVEATTLNLFATRVREFFVRRGFYDARVSAEVRLDGEHRAEMRFIVDRGQPITVRDVSFPGAVHMEASALREVLFELMQNELPFGEYRVPATPHEGTLAGGESFMWIRPEQIYVPDLYAEAARRMVNRYREIGFLDAGVANPRVERVQLRNGRTVLDIAFEVTEGPRTFLDEVTFEGNETIPSRTLADHTELLLGVPLSYAALDTARTSLVEFYREQGHSFARVTSHVERSPDRNHARIRFEVHEGPQVRVGHVDVRGNERTEEWVVRQRIAFHPGDLFRPSQVRATQRRLGETGFFSGVTVTPVDPEVEAPVKDIIVQVIEVLPQYLELRGGFSTGEGIRTGLEYGYRNINLFGLAFTAALGVQLGYQIPILGDPQYAANLNSLSILERLRRRISLSLIFAAIRPLGPSFRGSIDAATSRIIERQFAIDTNGVAATLTFRPERAFSLSLTPEVSANTLQILNGETIQGLITSAAPQDRERLVRLLLLPAGTTLVYAARLTGTIDLRDQVFNPRRGFYASATIEALGTDYFEDPANRLPLTAARPGNTVRTIASVAGYVPLPFLGIVFATNLRLGINVTFDTDRCPLPGDVGPSPRRVTYTNRLFFMGGADSMRGWLQDTMVPQDVVESYNFTHPMMNGPTGRNIVDRCTGDPLFPADLPTNTNPAQTNTIIAATQRGGDAFISLRNELRIPIGNTGFALGAFFDVGNLWKDIRNIDLALRFAAGGGVRYVTPIGPVAFDVGFPIARQAFESPYAFHFSIGLF
jgi:outer membrane protein assembly complex protein YaeT